MPDELPPKLREALDYPEIIAGEPYNDRRAIIALALEAAADECGEEMTGDIYVGARRCRNRIWALAARVREERAS